MNIENALESDAIVEEAIEDIQKKEAEILRAEQAILKDEEHILEEEVKAHEHHEFSIRIDREDYVVREHRLTGTELRYIPVVTIGPDRDLFEVVAGGSDRKISDTETIEMRNGLRLFTAPGQINPGMEGPQEERQHAATLRQ
ncbi:MAG: hypothetical protein ACRYFS_19935 [Janthinobacterium lividum]